MTDIRDAENYSDSIDIAIVGMSGRFPGARNIDEFWQNLRDGVESVTFFTDAELEAAGVDPDWLRDPTFVKAAPVLPDSDTFDAAFFGYSPREAALMDPQQRLFLETCWAALEHAGYNAEAYPGHIGVYAGVGMSSYLLNNLLTNHNFAQSTEFHQYTLGNDKDFLTTRVSYKLNLRGPSVNVQTACSTSLVAVHLACQSLLSYQSDMALAGGVTIRFPQATGYAYQEGNVFSPDGHCRAFDVQGQGTIFGSGVGAVVLKRMADAVADGDTIHAVIRGTAINNDGSLKVGYTAPSVDGQAEVIAMAQAMNDISPESISYIEAHGTGTPLGDPIEVSALTQVFRAGTTAKQFCAIGSVKSNVGHLDSAAGIAGLIKTVMALKEHQIPPSLHVTTPNPKIDWANSPFYVNTTLTEWKAGATPRRAGVSSFGMGGTNAHVVLEEAPQFAAAEPTHTWQLVPLSAKTPAALERATVQLRDYFKRMPDVSLDDVAFTLQTGRKPFAHRRVVIGKGIEEALIALGTNAATHVFSAIALNDCPVTFMFPGQGSQYVDMTRGLYQSQPVFRAAIDRCSAFLVAHLGFDLRDVLYSDAAGAVEAAARLTQTSVTQPALFVVEYALAQLWQAWGIRPQAMIGHSIGEYVAACLAGVFSLEDALALVALRGRLMQGLPPGAMLVVPLPEAEVRALLPDAVSVAAVNSPTLCVVAGSALAIAGVQTVLAARDVDCRVLHTSHAFHSLMMEPVIAPFVAALRSVPLNAPHIPYISNVTGTWITPEQATDPAYWATHLRQTVRFSDGLQTLFASAAGVLLEVGPGHSLGTLAKHHPAKTETHTVVTSVRHPQEHIADDAHMCAAIARLWCAGAPVDWTALGGAAQRTRLPLPTYPFERQRHWIAPAARAAQPQPLATIIPAPVPSPAVLDAEENPIAARILEQVIAQQIEIMGQQLDVWQSAH